VIPDSELPKQEREYLDEVERHILFEVKQLRLENFRSEDGIIEVPK